MNIFAYVCVVYGVLCFLLLSRTDCVIGFFCLFSVVSGLCLAQTAHEPTTSLHGTAPPPPICIALILLFRAPFCLLSSCSFFFCLFDSMHFLLLFSSLCFVARSVAVVWLLMRFSLFFLFASLELTQITIFDHL